MGKVFGRDRDVIRLAILGTGAVASMLGAIFRRYDPVLIGRRPIRHICVEGWGSQPLEFPVHSLQWQDPLPFSPDIILVAVKWPAMATVRTWLLRQGGHAPVLIFMNGMGQEEALASTGRPLGVTVTTMAVTRLTGANESAHIALHSPGHCLIPANMPAPVPALKAAAAVQNLSWQLREPPAIWQARWLKLVQNSIINPLSALAAVPNGALPDHPIWRLAPLLAAEAERVGEAEGVTLPTDLLAHVTELALATGANRSSMLQDVLSGKPTEIAAINGYLLRRARRHGVPTPVHGHVMALIQRLTLPVA